MANSMFKNIADEANVVQAPKPPILGASEIKSLKNLWESTNSKSPRIGGFRGPPGSLPYYEIIRQQYQSWWEQTSKPPAFGKPQYA